MSQSYVDEVSKLVVCTAWYGGNLCVRLFESLRPIRVQFYFIDTYQYPFVCHLAIIAKMDCSLDVLILTILNIDL